jgi:hypothetical protein
VFCAKRINHDVNFNPFLLRYKMAVLLCGVLNWYSVLPEDEGARARVRIRNYDDLRCHCSRLNGIGDVEGATEY